MKRGSKQVKDMLGFSMIGAGGSLALGSIGGAAATSGQAGISNMAKFAPAMGSVMGAGMMIRQVKQLEQKKKRR